MHFGLFVSSLYTETFQAQYGGPAKSQEGLEDQLKAIVPDAARIAVNNDDGEMVVAAVTPLMDRANELPEAAEIIFVDASGNMDRGNLRIFLLMTWSVAGGMPLGVIITTSESEAIISKGLQMLQKVMPEGKKNIDTPLPASYPVEVFIHNAIVVDRQLIPSGCDCD